MEIKQWRKLQLKWKPTSLNPRIVFSPDDVSLTPWNNYSQLRSSTCLASIECYAGLGILGARSRFISSK